MTDKKQKEEKLFFKTFGAFVVCPPPWAAKMHGGFMHDGTPMDDIKSVNEFWDHIAHTEGLEIMDKAQGKVNSDKLQL